VHMHSSSPLPAPEFPVSPAASPCHCANLRRAARAVTRFYDAALAPSGLTVTQYSLLRTMARLEPATAGDLGPAMALDRTTLVRNLRPLTDRGLIAETAPPNRRARPLGLTPAGRNALEAAHPLWRAAQQQMAETLGQADLDALLAAAAKLENMGP